MKTIKMNLITIILFAILLQGCASTIIGTATDAAIAAAKIPVKVGKAVVDTVTPDEDE